MGFWMVQGYNKRAIKMKIVKRITVYDTDPEMDFYLVSDGAFLIHAVKQQQFENRTGKHEHPVLIAKEPWELYDVTLGTWVFKRANKNKEQILVLKEVARMRLSDFTTDSELTSDIEEGDNKNE